MTKYLNAFSIFLISIIIACGKSTSQQENIASVNDSPISVKEFQKEVSILTKRNPAFKVTPQALEEQLGTLIDKKLLLQEAMKKGLPEDPHFAETIKTFWEQTLIRELLEQKAREWGDRVFITEEEINRQYERMKYLPVIRLVKAENREKAEEAMGRMLKGLRVEGEETVGPLSIEDIRNVALINAFDMGTGKGGAYEDNGGYLVMHVIKKEKAMTPPLKEVYGRVKSSLLERKKQRLMEDWLKDTKRYAKIEINSRMLERIANEK